MLKLLLSICIAWTLCSQVLSQVDDTEYCPENGQTETLSVILPTTIRTVFARSSAYIKNQNCRWVINAGPDPNQRIHIEVVESDLQWTPPDTDCSRYDYIELRNGGLPSSPLLKTWCGGASPYTVISEGNTVYVSFASDDIHLSNKTGVTLRISTFSVGSGTMTCPPGWVFPVNSPTNCYSIKTHSETWKDAQGYCNDDGANLVTLRTAAEEAYILDEAKRALNSQKNKSLWIGLNDIIKEGQFVWADSTESATSFSSSKVPSRSEQYKDCMTVTMEDGVWREDHCHRPEVPSSAKHPFVCERKMDGTTVAQPSPPVEAITYYCQADGKILFITSAESARIVTRAENTTHYGKGLECRWIINSGREQNKRIHISVTSSDLQWTPADAICYGYDHIQIRDGPNEDSPVLSHFCGSMNPYSVISSSNVLFISFESNDRQIYSHAGATLDFSFFTVAPSRQECPPGWFSESPTAKYCYSIKTHTQTWVQAQQYCNNDQANLVSFETEDEEKFVLDYAVQTLVPLRMTKMWIGLNDIVEEGKQEWIDGVKSTAKSRILEEPYTSSVYLDCVVVRLDQSDRMWEEEFCTEGEVQTTSQYPFVCKRKRDGSSELFSIPQASPEKEGKKGNLPPKAAIIAGAIAAILVLIGIGALVYFKFVKNRSSPSSYSSPAHSPAATAYTPNDHPPSYDEVAKGDSDFPGSLQEDEGVSGPMFYENVHLSGPLPRLEEV